MGERLVFIKETIQEVLGPRGGSREMVDFRPDDDGGYITGWLAPYNSSAGQAEDGDRGILLQNDGIGTGSEEELAGGDPETSMEVEDRPDFDAKGISGSEDQDAGPDVAGRLGQQTLPSLEPGKMPSTMGISFLARGELISLSICSTWARYAKLPPEAEDPRRQSRWRCTPHGDVRDVLLEAGSLDPINLEDGSLWMEFRMLPQRADGSRIVSVFLVNRAERAGGAEAPVPPQGHDARKGGPARQDHRVGPSTCASWFGQPLPPRVQRFQGIGSPHGRAGVLGVGRHG